MNSGAVQWHIESMKKSGLNIKSEREFFERGRSIAKLADAGMPLTETAVMVLQSPKNLKKRKPKSKILEAIYESAKDMHSMPLIDDQRMKEYEETCL